MIIRFGYVAMALGLLNGSPNKTVTVKNLLKIEGRENRINKLRKLARENLSISLRVLKYNIAHQIQVYRSTSNLIPLATHSLIEGWNYIEDLKEDLDTIGQYINQHQIRVSAHPDHFTLLNSPKPDVLTNALKDLNYHASLFDAMHLAHQVQLVLHIGGVYKNKKEAANLFCERFTGLPDNIKNRIILENDDKSFGTSEVLSICQKLACPMVLDIHHHACISREEDLRSLWPQIAATWKTQTPKIHLSSPKNPKDFRSHADYVNPDDFLPFLHIAKESNTDLDVMIEAKQKDQALFTLIKDLEKLTFIKVIDQATVKL